MHLVYFVVAKLENDSISNCCPRFRLWSVGTPTKALGISMVIAFTAIE
jgi:hypothetical protein